MPHSDPVNWQPISKMPLIARMIDGALDDTRIHLETLTQARTRPHVLDDATIDRSKEVHTEQLEFVGIYARQISRWPRRSYVKLDHATAEVVPQLRGDRWFDIEQRSLNLRA